jgi:Na+-driven multidrug efflux pump
VINFFCYWLFQLPLAYFLAHHAGFGAKGAFMAIAIAEALIAVIGILVFRKGKWKERSV